MSFRNAYGHTVSENGWRMCNPDECAIVRIPDLFLVDTAPLRIGAPLTILGAWLKWYDRNVEEIASQVWGWSATNDVPNSNHLSGTAVDINAPRYPWGARVMPADRIAKVRKGLALFEGSVFWGADWSRADEMHYQMAWREGDRRNDAFAAKLRGGYLGIYGPEPKPPLPEGNTDVDQATGDKILRTNIAILDQLAGKGVGQAVADGKPWPAPAGWPQGGDRSLYDLAAATAAGAGVPGARDTKAAK